MIQIDERKYTNLLEDYIELKQTNTACEQEYKNLCERYNGIVNTLKTIQAIIDNSKRNSKIKEIKEVLKDIC